MSDPGPATRWAHDQPTDQPVRWKGLEVAAFAHHPRVLNALEPGRGRVEWWWVPVAVLGLALALVFFYPAGAFLLLADGQVGRFDVAGMNSRLAITLAGALLLVGGVVHLVAVLRRTRRDQFAGGFDTVAVMFGAFDVFAIARRGAADDVTGWPGRPGRAAHRRTTGDRAARRQPARRRTP